MAASEFSVSRINGKVRPHPTQNEALLFEKSSPGNRAYKLAPLDVPAVDAASLLGAAHRTTPGELPELSDIEIIRHFTRLSTWNYAIDLGMYPLGSCTMSSELLGFSGQRTRGRTVWLEKSTASASTSARLPASREASSPKT